MSPTNEPKFKPTTTFTIYIPHILAGCKVAHYEPIDFQFLIQFLIAGELALSDVPLMTPGIRSHVLEDRLDQETVTSGEK